MNKQALFNRVATHLLTQGQRSIAANIAFNGDPGCAYRGEDGLKCAVGVLISDSRYTPKMENLPVCQLITKFGKRLPKFFTVHYNMLASLQDIHDRSSEEHWRIDLERYAKKHGLEMPKGLPVQPPR